MTRQELYDLVWQTPMTKLAKTYGLSDVGLRKICVKYDIPTPPLGYWAKRTHGKKVKQPRLPERKTGIPETLHLVVHETAAVPVEVAGAQEAALSRDATFPKIVVPTERPAKLHHVALATSRALKATKIDRERFKICAISGGVEVAIGADSVDRVVSIIDAIAAAAEVRGYHFAEDSGGVRIVVDGVPIAWRIHETKDKTEHTPTKDELAAQKRREEWRRDYPSLYSQDRETKAYRSWDYFPSGRLVMTFRDTTLRRWERPEIGQWYDRKNASLESYLDEAMRTLALKVVNIKQRLVDEAEQQRLKEEAQAQRQREQARRERAAKRHDYLLRKANDYDRYLKLRTFAEHMERARSYEEPDVVDRLIDELVTITDAMGEGLERAAITQEAQALALYTEDDPLPPEDDDV